jgi:hypothetical protein
MLRRGRARLLAGRTVPGGINASSIGEAIRGEARYVDEIVRGTMVLLIVFSMLELD